MFTKIHCIRGIAIVIIVVSDNRKVFRDTILAIETDEFGHREYVKKDRKFVTMMCLWFTVKNGFPFVFLVITTNSSVSIAKMVLPNNLRWSMRRRCLQWQFPVYNDMSWANPSKCLFIMFLTIWNHDPVYLQNWKGGNTEVIEIIKLFYWKKSINQTLSQLRYKIIYRQKWTTTFFVTDVWMNFVANKMSILHVFVYNVVEEADSS